MAIFCTALSPIIKTFAIALKFNPFFKKNFPPSPSSCHQFVPTYLHRALVILSNITANRKELNTTLLCAPTFI